MEGMPRHFSSCYVLTHALIKQTPYLPNPSEVSFLEPQINVFYGEAIASEKRLQVIKNTRSSSSPSPINQVSYQTAKEMSIIPHNFSELPQLLLGLIYKPKWNLLVVRDSVTDSK